MKRATEDALSMLAGAGLGVAMMYLFDPESGARRRQRLGEATREQLAHAGDTAGNAFGMLSAHAADLAENLRSGGSELTSDWSSRAADAARSLADSARGMAESSGATGWLGAAREKLSGLRDRFSDSASDAYEGARDTKRRWVRSAAQALGAEPEHHYVGQTVCALGSLALGAGLLWAFDPRLGRSRRAWLADKSGRWTRDTGELFRRSGKYLAGRMKGSVAETRSYLRSRHESPDDRTLCARVRSELGRAVRSMNDVQVQARDGYVVLMGEVDGPEIDTAANYVLGIRGVRGLDCRLRPRGSAASSGATSGANTIGFASPEQRSAEQRSAQQRSAGQYSGPAPSQTVL